MGKENDVRCVEGKRRAQAEERMNERLGRKERGSWGALSVRVKMRYLRRLVSGGVESNDEKAAYLIDEEADG